MKIDMWKSENGISRIWVNKMEFKKFVKEVWNRVEKSLDKGKWVEG